MEIELVRESADVRFIITDERGPAADVKVTLNGLQMTGTGTGIVDFPDVRLEQPVSYLVEKKGFRSISDTFMLDTDTVISHVLDPSVAWVKFRVKEDGLAVPDAEVQLNDSVQLTNLVGTATFTGVPLDSLHSYSVSKQGYLTFGEQFVLRTDTTINVELVYTSVPAGQYKRISIYPNPTTHSLHISGLRGGELLRMYDQSGEIVRKVEAVGTRMTLSLTDLVAGTYYLQCGDHPPVSVVKGL